MPGAIDPFEIGVRAVLGQQVSVAAATRLAGRVVEAHGRPVPGLEALGLRHLFPTPPALARADLTTAGVTTSRAAAIRAFAQAVADGTIALRVLEDIGRERTAEVERAAHELERLLGDVRFTPRFPAPLHKELRS